MIDVQIAIWKGEFFSCLETSLHSFLESSFSFLRIYISEEGGWLGNSELDLD